MSAARKPRLTDHLLADLEVGVQVFADEMTYLGEAVTHHADRPALQARLREKHRSVARSHEWLSRHIEAVRSQRGVGEDGSAQDGAGSEEREELHEGA